MSKQGQITEKQVKAGKPPRGESTNMKRKSDRAAWTFPQNSLETAIKLIQQVEEKYAGKPTKAESLVKLAGYNKPNDWRFLVLLRSCNQYGLTEGAGEKAVVSLTPLAQDILAPSSPVQRQKALLQTFHNVELFKRVYEYYAGKKIPDDEYFGNTLVREFDVPRDRVPTFIQVFTENLNYLRAFAADKALAPPEGSTSAGQPKDAVKTPIVQKSGREPQETGIREYLDTCFILMPFGDWYDRYFKEIYIPATKDAGFEPVRADGVFTTGSVIEQIWEQITKGKVLLAELTGKNPNVFYELGLAHAICKPVVLIAGDLEDVPFDLRHLRTILYDVREPDWGIKLRASITAHLKSAKSEPEKTIPQPFRDSVNADNKR
jgi:hypothetical protein